MRRDVRHMLGPNVICVNGGNNLNLLGKIDMLTQYEKNKVLLSVVVQFTNLMQKKKNLKTRMGCDHALPSKIRYLYPHIR
jgi:hypothetical protein